MADGEATARNPQAIGVASTWITLSLMKTLVAKGVITDEEASKVISTAADGLKTQGPSLARAAVQIIEEDIAPAFKPR